jgi:phosphate-selective porin OprO/OprP
VAGVAPDVTPFRGRIKPLRATRLAVWWAPVRLARALFVIPLAATIQVVPALAQRHDGAAAADTVQQQGPTIRVGHGDGGWEIETSDGSYLMQVQLRLQLRYAYPRDTDPITFDDFSDGDQYLFKVNRSRLKIAGNAFKPWLKYYMEYELGGNALMDFRLMVEKWPALQLKVGQWKVEYNRERIIAWDNQQMLERSILNRPFTIDRQQGVSLYGHLKGPGVADFNYWASVFTGTGRGARENDDDQLMYVARVQWNVFGRSVPFSGSDLEYQERPAAVLAFAAATNRSPYTRFATAGPGQLVAFEEEDENPIPGHYRVNQWMQETAFQYRGFAWQQEFHRKEVNDKINLTTTTLVGAYFQAGYFFHYLWPAFPKPLELAARIAYYDPDIDRSDDLLREYSFAGTWFLNGHLNRLTADLTFFRFDFPELADQDQWRFRIQWDIST